MSNNRHPDWENEKKITQNMPKWREQLLSRVSAILGEWGQWADKVGFKPNETQIQYEKPIDSYFSYGPLDVLWVRFNTYDPITKRPATRSVRFGPNTATLMVLLKVPQGDSFKWYLLARRKYQFAGKDHFTEFSRGWIKGIPDEDYGWKLFERDFPGLKDHPSVCSIFEEQMGNSVLENDAEFSNLTSEHLIVVELKPGTDVNQIRKDLVDAKLRQEYGNEYSQNLDEDDLVSKPVVYELDEAAKLLNAHISKVVGAVCALFGERFSQSCWKTFLSLHGVQFSHLMPISEVNL